jgi:peptidoglycan biosynthesis protein MviN/MurJ (putative lipid II flippase)
MPFMKHSGIALASSISVFAQVLIQHKYLTGFGIHIPKEHLRQFGKMFAAALIMGIVLVPFACMNIWNKGMTLKSCLLLFSSIVLGGVMYFGSLWVMGMRGFPGRQKAL